MSVGMRPGVIGLGGGLGVSLGVRPSRRPTSILDANLTRFRLLALQAVPFTIVSYIRGMYVIGMAEEFRLTNMRFNGIWPVGQQEVSPMAAVLMLATNQAVSGEIYAEQPMPPSSGYQMEYSKGVHFVDYTSIWLAEQDA